MFTKCEIYATSRLWVCSKRRDRAQRERHRHHVMSKDRRTDRQTDRQTDDQDRSIMAGEAWRPLHAADAIDLPSVVMTKEFQASRWKRSGLCSTWSSLFLLTRKSLLVEWRPWTLIRTVPSVPASARTHTYARARCGVLRFWRRWQMYDLLTLKNSVI